MQLQPSDALQVIISTLAVQMRVFEQGFALLLVVLEALPRCTFSIATAHDNSSS
jgi:hypothetical protein